MERGLQKPAPLTTTLWTFMVIKKNQGSSLTTSLYCFMGMTETVLESLVSRNEYMGGQLIGNGGGNDTA